MTGDDSKIMAARITIYEAAQNMLAGSLSYIEGSRNMRSSFLMGLGRPGEPVATSPLDRD